MIKVAAIIPTYKRNDQLPRAIDSVLKQTYKNIVAVVIDDNDENDEFSNGVKRIVSNYSNSNRVIYCRQPNHINGASARNYGVSITDAEYIAFLDDDDEWMPDKIEKQLSFLSLNKDYKGCSCLYNVIENDKIIRSCKPYEDNDLQLKVFLRKVAICTPTFICEKQAFVEFGGFDVSLERHQDLQLFIDFLEKNKIHVINEYLVNVYSDSKINRPNTKKLINAKKKLFESTSNAYLKYDKKTKRRIRNVHNFEIVFVALRNKNIFVALRYLLKIGFSFSAYKDLFERIRERKR